MRWTVFGAALLISGCGSTLETGPSGPDCELTTWQRDADFDGAGDPDVSIEDCVGEPPLGYTDNSDDCDDYNVSVHPGQTESCNGVDDDCDGQVDNGAAGAPVWYADADGDGYGANDAPTVACEAPDDHVHDSSDCDDRDPNVRPGVPELCDGIDNNCDGTIDEVDELPFELYYRDVDGDGYGDPKTETASCTPLSGYALNGQDCNDGDSGINPSAEEVCEDGIDNNCDGSDDLCVYMFSGILTNVDMKELIGWEECFVDLFRDTSDLSSVWATCTMSNILVGCRQVGSSTMVTAANAPFDDVFTDTGTSNVTHDANGVGWYYSSSYSMGYAAVGDSLSRNSCDTASGTYPTQRLCFHTSSSRLTGGYRCGSTTGLNSSTTWERVFMQAEF